MADVYGAGSGKSFWPEDNEKPVEAAESSKSKGGAIAGAAVGGAIAGAAAMQAARMAQMNAEKERQARLNAEQGLSDSEKAAQEARAALEDEKNAHANDTNAYRNYTQGMYNQYNQQLQGVNQQWGQREQGIAQAYNQQIANLNQQWNEHAKQTGDQWNQHTTGMNQAYNRELQGVSQAYNQHISNLNQQWNEHTKQTADHWNEMHNLTMQGLNQQWALRERDLVNKFNERERQWLKRDADMQEALNAANKPGAVGGNNATAVQPFIVVPQVSQMQPIFQYTKKGMRKLMNGEDIDYGSYEDYYYEPGTRGYRSDPYYGGVDEDYYDDEYDKPKKKAKPSAIFGLIFGILLLAVMIVPHFVKQAMLANLNVITDKAGLTMILDLVNTFTAGGTIVIKDLLVPIGLAVCGMFSALTLIINLFSVRARRYPIINKLFATLAAVGGVLAVVMLFVDKVEGVMYGAYAIAALSVIIALAAWLGKRKKY